MELFEPKLDKLSGLLDELDDAVHSTRASLIRKHSFDEQKVKDIFGELTELIYEMRKNLPQEINSARKVLRNQESLLNEAREDADMIRRQAEMDYDRLVDEHEITQAAKREYDRLIDEAKDEIEASRKSAAEFIYNTFHDADLELQGHLARLINQNETLENFYRELIGDIVSSKNMLGGGS